MKGLILELRGPFAIVLFPGGELRRVLRRRGWRVGMIVDPDAARSGGFVRAGLALAAVLVLMLGLGAFRTLAPRSDVPLDATADAREPLRLVTPDAPDPSPTGDAPDPSPSATAALPAEEYHGGNACPVCRADDHVLDDHCEYCGEIGHDDDDCPYAPPGWDDDKYNYCPLCKVEGHVLDDHCAYCGEIGHDDDDCPYAPPGWDD